MSKKSRGNRRSEAPPASSRNARDGKSVPPPSGPKPSVSERPGSVSIAPAAEERPSKAPPVTLSIVPESLLTHLESDPPPAVVAKAEPLKLVKDDEPAEKKDDSSEKKTEERRDSTAPKAEERRDSTAPKSSDRRDSTAPKSGKGKGKGKRDSAPPPASERDTKVAKDVAIAEVVDHRLDDHAEEFFSKPSLPHLDDHDDDDDVHVPAATRARALALASEAAEKRRAEVRKYVQIGLAVCAVLVAFGLYKVYSAPKVDAGMPTTPVEATAKPEEKKPEPAKPVETAKPVASVEAAPSASASAVASAAPSAAPSSEAAVPGAPPSEDDKKAAKVARTKAERLIDSGKYADAIAIGEDATRLDPTHAQGWLLLGAARDAKGDRAGAKAAYRECVKQATTGPKGECASFAR